MTDVKLRKQDARYTIYDLEYAPSCVLSVTYLNPGQSTVGHKHGYAEGYYFVKGVGGRIELGQGGVRDVVAGEFVTVPPDTFHRVYNGGVCEALVFVCAFCVK